MSSNGNDSWYCGSNVSVACRTLDCLLERFHNTTYKSKETLVLATDTDLTLDVKLLVCVQQVFIHSPLLLPPNAVWGQSIIFIGVCHSFRPHGGGGGLHPGVSASGVYPSGEVCIQGVLQSGGLHSGGWADPPPCDATRYGQQSGGTHPTGMHSCHQFFFFN